MSRMAFDPTKSCCSLLLQAYKYLARRLHPDKGGSPAAFASLQSAFHTLSDPQLQ